MLISIITIIVLIISAIFHEYAHGWVAYKLGDHTAKDAGRLTLNPIAHIDPVGSILLPLLLVLSRASFIVGWAKPVPYNPYNLRDQKYGDLKVALGGPATNFVLALFFGLLARTLPMAAGLKQALVLNFLGADSNAVLTSIHGSALGAIFFLSIVICFVNLLLMVFNLVPVPPLDGSKILLTFLPHNLQQTYRRLEVYGFFILIFLLWLGIFDFIFPLILSIFSLIVGV